MSTIAAVPGLAMAWFGAMTGLSGSNSMVVTVMAWIAAVIGAWLTLMMPLAVLGVFPKTGAGKAKPAAKAAAVEKPSKKEEAAEPASEELDVAEDEEFAEASDEFASVDDDDLGFEDEDDDQRK
jgi:hypothetical protein